MNHETNYSEEKMKKNRMQKSISLFYALVITVLLVSLAGVLPSQAAAVSYTYVWVGTTSDWMASSNWSGGAVGGIPTNNDTATLNSGAANYPNIVAAGAVAKTANINTGASITVSPGGTLTIATTNINSGGSTTISGGTLVTTGGTLTIASGATLTQTGGTFNFKDLDILGTYALSSGTATGTGTITIPSGVTFTQSGGALTIEKATIQGDYVRTGGTATGTGDITISGTAATQNIAGFTTTGNLTMSKTAGTATFTSNMGGKDFTINGTGGTLHLGSGLTHTFSGKWKRQAGTLNGGSSTLRLGDSVDAATTGTFVAGTGTVEYYKTTAQTIMAVTYNNLILSGSGSTKTINTGTSVGANLNINTGVLAAIAAGQTIPVDTLTMGGIGRASGTWGSTSSAATHKDNTWFTATTGMLNVTTSTQVKVAPVIAFGAAPTPTYLGGDFTVSATTDNTDSSTLTYSRVSGPCAWVSGATFSSSGAGTCVVRADGAETDNFLAGFATQDVIIGKATPTATLFVTNPSVTYDGDPHFAIVDVSSSSTPGTVASVLTGGAATQSAIGIYAVTADFIPTNTTDFNSLTGLSAGNFEINAKWTQTTLVVTGPVSLTYGSTAFVTTSGGSGGGAMTYFTTGATTGCSVNTSTGELSVTNASGVCIIKAIKAEDAQYNPAVSEPFTVTLNKAAQAVVTISGPASITVGTTGTYVGAGGSGSGAISYSTSGGGCSVVPATGVVSVVNASLPCSVTATRAASNNYLVRSSTPLSVTLVKLVPVLHIDPTNVTYDGNPHGTTVLANVGGAVDVSSVRYNGSTTLPSALGTYPVTANFTPNDTNNYATLTNAPAGDFIITNFKLDMVHFQSNNANPAYANTGNIVTLTFHATEDIGTPPPTVTIAGHAVVPSYGPPWTATYTMVIGDTEGVIPFVINYQNGMGFARTATATTDGSSVTFDKTAPVITVSSPAASSFINNITTASDVSFSFTEALGSASIVITQTGGTFDATSPHTCSLVGTALNSGAHNALDLSNTTNGCSAAQTLTSGGIYTFAFSGTDLAGNVATPVSRTNVTFDNTPPLITSTIPANGATDTLIGSNISLLWSEVMDTATVKAANISINPGSWVSEITCAGTPSACSLYPTGQAPLTTYTITFSAAVTDRAGNPLTGAPVSFHYTTGVVFDASITTWVAPPGAAFVDVYVWGGGGKGSNLTGAGSGGGGGGGAFSMRAGIPVTPGASYSIHTGLGASGSMAAGGDSYFINTSTVMAKGGESAPPDGDNGGAGGAAADGAGDTKYSGGDGADGLDPTYSGGGGSSAGYTANGTDAIDSTGAIAPTDGGNGGNGVSGGVTGNGLNGSDPGGGGGGSFSTGGNATGGSGANGLVAIYVIYGTSVGISCDSPAYVGIPTTCTATVTRLGGTDDITGEVEWEITSADTGTFITSPCELSGSGATASCDLTYTPTALGTGTHVLGVTYTGDDNYGWSESTAPLTVTTLPAVIPDGIQVLLNGGWVGIKENEVLKQDFEQFRITFTEDMVNVDSSSPDWGKSVINPANYMLVWDKNDGHFSSTSCLTGVDPNDQAIPITSVTYERGSLVDAKYTGPFVATIITNGKLALDSGNYRFYVCGTTSITDYDGIKLAGNGSVPGTDYIRNFTINVPQAAAQIPSTGFAPNRVTKLPAQPAEQAYSALGNVWLEIPKLGVKENITGIPEVNGTWEVKWLDNDIGWLQGSAFPSWAGNSVLTGHYFNASGNAGPFRYIYTLWYGDQIIVHAWDKTYTYEVRSVQQVNPDAIDVMMKHEETAWLTLVTCRGYLADEVFQYRVLVRAVLVK